MNRDAAFYAMVISMLPIFFTGTISFWMMTKLTFITKSVSERSFDIMAYAVVIICATVGAIIYFSFGKNPHAFFPLFIMGSFVIGRILVGYLIRRLFNEDMD